MLNKIIIGIVVFFCGAVVMAFEILGSRLLGPYTGTSVTVWTAIIGIIVAGLSLGYWAGGTLSDKHPDYRILSAIVFSASIFIALTWLLKDPLLNFIMRSIDHPVLSAIIAALVLFSVPSFLLGMVSPFSARLVMVNIENSGLTAGTVYAISTAGSIAGTFLAGFVLIPFLKVSVILLVFSAILILISILLFVAFKNRQAYV